MIKNITVTGIAALLALGTLSACGERDEPVEEQVEEAGDDFEDGMENIGDEMEEAGDDMERGMEDMADDMEEGVEEMEDELDDPTN